MDIYALVECYSQAKSPRRLVGEIIMRKILGLTEKTIMIFLLFISKMQIENFKALGIPNGL